MKRIFIPLIGFCAACGPPEIKSETGTAIQVVEPDTVTAKHKKTDSSEAFDKLPLRWEMITNKNEKFVRYAPCDGENPWVEIDKKNKLILVNWGQDGETNKIISWQYSEEQFKDEMEYYFHFKIEGEYLGETSVTLNYNKSGKVSSWRGLDGSDEPQLYIPETYFDKYPIVKQPCLECFSEEECDEISGKK